MHLTRRSLLGAAAVGTAATAAPQFLLNAQASSWSDRQAAGYNRLSFFEDFNSINAVDTTASGRGGYSFYTDLPWSGSATPAHKIQVRDSVLTLDQAITNQNVALTSLSPRTGAGSSFSFGYFEIRMAFDASISSSVNGYPSLWMLPKSQLFRAGRKRHAEIDIFEAYHEAYRPYRGHFCGTIHDASPLGDGSWNYRAEQNRNNVVDAGIVTPAWHTYGCLWQPGKVTWYLDDRWMTEVSYGPNRRPSATTWDTNTGRDVNTWGAFSVLDQAADEGLGMMLGTAPGWPIRIDWVKVWQR